MSEALGVTTAAEERKTPFRADNPLFAMARRGRRLPHIALVIFLILLFTIVGEVIGGFGSDLLLPLLFPGGAEAAAGSATGSGLIEGATLIIGFAPIVLVFALWMALYERRPFWTVGFPARGALWKYVRGFLVGAGMFAIAVGISGTLGYIAPEQGAPALQGTAALGGVMIILLGWLVQGASEEIMSRGWTLQVVGARYGLWIGVAISSISFALLHGFNPGFGLLPALNLTLFGVFAALYALREGSIWGICAWHSAWNWAQGNLFGLDVSGMAMPGGTLLNMRENGPDLVTGGAFGPEGGLAVTAVLLVAITAMFRADMRRKRPQNTTTIQADVQLTRDRRRDLTRP